MAMSYCVSISKEYAEQIKKYEISPSDAFKRGVAMFIREKEFNEDDNPGQLKEKIQKMSLLLQQKTEEYELLKQQYETEKRRI